MCNNKCVVDYIDGQLRTSIYCDWHYCRVVEGGRMCYEAKPPRIGRYCKERELGPKNARGEKDEKLRLREQIFNAKGWIKACDVPTRCGMAIL